MLKTVKRLSKDCQKRKAVFSSFDVNESPCVRILRPSVCLLFPSKIKVDEVLFPGMTRRFRIFEPRYRALVKQCLADDEPLVILPLSRGGNTVATAARVSSLHNVEEDGRCEKTRELFVAFAPVWACACTARVFFCFFCFLGGRGGRFSEISVEGYRFILSRRRRDDCRAKKSGAAGAAVVSLCFIAAMVVRDGDEKLFLAVTQ